MSSTHDVVAYAREVYAACATIGYVSDATTSLKALLDAVDAGGEPPRDLVSAAEKAHRAAARWTMARR